MAKTEPTANLFEALRFINRLKPSIETPISPRRETWDTNSSTAWRASLLYILSLSNGFEQTEPEMIKYTLVSILAYPIIVSKQETQTHQTPLNNMIATWFNEATTETKTTAQSYIDKSHGLAIAIHNNTETPQLLLTDDSDSYEFMETVEVLTSMFRFQSQSYWSDYKNMRFDTVSEHSWALSLSIYLLDLYGLISMKTHELVSIMIMAIIHDLEESTTSDKCPIGREHGNDTHAFNEEKRKEKNKEARDAFNDLSESLPTEKRSFIRNLFNGTLDCKNPTVILLKAMDTLEACFQIHTMTDWKLVPNHLEWSIKYTNFRSQNASEKIRSFVQYCLNRFTATTT